MPSTQRSASSRETLASSRTDSSTLRAITGSITLSSKLPDGAAERDRGVVADHLRAHHRARLGDHRVHLAGHDRRARLQVGQVDLGEPGARAGAHPAQVVGDLGAATTAIVRSCAGQLDEPVAGALRLEVVARLGQRQARSLRRRSAMTVGGEPGRRVDAGADGGAAERQLGEPRQRGLQPLDAVGAPARRSRRTPGRASPASRPSGGCGRS